jgi:PKD repeat protein
MKTQLQLKTLLCCFAFVLLISACKKKELPVADFTVTVSGKTAQFTNTSTNAKTYYWDFDNTNVAKLDLSKRVSDEASPSFTYPASGTYTVVLRVLNLDEDLNASYKTQVVVIP